MPVPFNLCFLFSLFCYQCCKGSITLGSAGLKVVRILVENSHNTSFNMLQYASPAAESVKMMTRDLPCNVTAPALLYAHRVTRRR